MHFVLNNITGWCQDILQFIKRGTCDFNYFRKKVLNKPRWGYNNPPHTLLHDIINQRRTSYKKLLTTLVEYKQNFLRIPKYHDKSNRYEPHLDNHWLPGLDSFVLYSVLGIYKPDKFIEVGSGNSTKFARRSIRDNQLKTMIYSIDPQPRVGCDAICDQIIRKPVEELDVRFFDKLNSGDILFVDSSHRCFMGSDVTTMFIDVLPRLKAGVIVEFHDIFLPYDYPPHWGRRYYQEQYLLAAYLLAEGNKFEILLPNAFISHDPELMAILAPVLSDKKWGNANRGGGSFWIVMGNSHLPAFERAALSNSNGQRC
jgi:hypothetical protein